MNESSLKWVTWLSESPVDYLEKLGQPMAREENLVRKRIRTTNPQNISSSDTRNFHWNPQSIKKLAEWPLGTYFTSTGEFRRNNLINFKKKTLNCGTGSKWQVRRLRPTSEDWRVVRLTPLQRGDGGATAAQVSATSLFLIYFILEFYGNRSSGVNLCKRS